MARLIASLLLLVAFAAPASGQTLMEGTVVHVADGDTVDVQLGEQVVRLRLIGMDTPETVDPRTPVQCFGREASARAKELLEGQTVRIELDPSQGERDRYDRLLAYLWLSDGTFFNGQMIAEGYAHEYTYDLPYAYQEAFRAAETQARDQGLGLWAADTCAGETDGAAGADLAAAALPPAVGYTGPHDPAGADRDCKDFRTHAEAQAFFLAAQAVTGQRDRHRLDSDGDGIACESLP